jgi:predicted choloylglycine hydrolase
VIALLDDPAVDADAFTESFLRAPLFSTSYANGFGTLYTAAYRPALGDMRLIWPTRVWDLGFDRFEAGEHTEVLAEPTFATSAG